MRRASWAKSVAVAVWSLGCGGPSLSVPGQESAVAFQLEPAASPDAAPLVWRARLGPPSAAQPWLLAGELSSYYARELKQGTVPSALRERAVPLRYWQEGSDRLLQPLVPLQPAATYTLALLGFGAVQVVQTRAEASPRVERLFPAAGRPKYQLSVVCNVPAPLPPSLLLEPGALSLQIDRDLLGELAPGCIVLSVAEPLLAEVVAPPEILGTLLEPSPWLPEPAATGSEGTCGSGQPWHGACLELDDDRVRVTSLSRDQLWLLREPTPRLVVSEPGLRSVLARDLEPDRAVVLRGTVLSSTGTREDFELPLEPRAPRRHLVLNEVLANPLGAETTGEWIELLNDSARPASLAGLWLEDAGGHAALPEVGLAPGELALLVPPGFRTVAPDAPLPTGARVIELESLGARGLSNSGEALLLVGAEGFLSRFPALPATHAGKSWARRSPDAADGDARAFVEQSPSPGAPNGGDG